MMLANRLFTLLAFSTVGFYLWLVFAGLLPNLITRPLHMLLALPWIFLSPPLFKKQSGFAKSISLLASSLGAVILFALMFNRDTIIEQYGMLYGHTQIIAAFILIWVVLLMAKRQIKWALPSVAMLALLYAAFGQYLPNAFAHQIPFEAILGDLTITEAGLWGMLTGTSVSVISVFIILGALIGAGAGGQAFMQFSLRLAGHYRAGAAKVAILSSALFGSISGSATANVASTGSITIPAMSKLGYPKPLAAAVEATASTGGQIMPPLMGAGAFVMVELLQLPYRSIMLAAAIPAVLFFAIAWLGVDRFALRYDLKPIPKAQLPAWRQVLKLLPYFLLPFTVLLFFLFFTQKTAAYAAAFACFAAVPTLFFDEKGASWSGFIQRLQQAVIAACQQIAMMAAIIICVGIIIGVLNQTGLGVKLASMILNLSAGQFSLALLLTALTCLILGMEIPTTAAYVICIAVAEPILLGFNMPPLHAHLFVYWYALLSCITPPVCGTVFVAATLANTAWTKTAAFAMRLSAGLYVLPLAFATNPELLTPDKTPLVALLVTIKAFIACFLIVKSLTDKATLWLRAILLLAGLGLLLSPSQLLHF